MHGGQRIGDITGIDPTVFIDDDGQAYYFWDQFSARGAKLNPDMKTLDMSTLHEGIVTEQEHGIHEGSFVFKLDYFRIITGPSRPDSWRGLPGSGPAMVQVLRWASGWLAS